MNIKVVQGDITLLKVDAVVNAANSGLLQGGGVDGAIRRIEGEELHNDCLKIRRNILPRGLPVGEAIETKAYKLNAKIIIHTVGPRFYHGDIQKLENCYISCLKVAEKNNCRSIAFPAISTGAYGCPIEKSAEIAFKVLTNYKSNIINDVILVLYKDKDYDVYNQHVSKIH